jgi:hypothetical protein
MAQNIETMFTRLHARRLMLAVEPGLWMLGTLAGGVLALRLCGQPSTFSDAIWAASAVQASAAAVGLLAMWRLPRRARDWRRTLLHALQQRGMSPPDRTAVYQRRWVEYATDLTPWPRRWLSQTYDETLQRPNTRARRAVAGTGTFLVLLAQGLVWFQPGVGAVPAAAVACLALSTVLAVTVLAGLAYGRPGERDPIPVIHLPPVVLSAPLAGVTALVIWLSARVSHAPDFNAGVDRALTLATVLWGAVELRDSILPGLKRLERGSARVRLQALTNLVTEGACVATKAGSRLLGWSALILAPCALALEAARPDLAAAASTWFMVAVLFASLHLMLAPFAGDWQRPRRPRTVDADEVAEALSDPRVLGRVQVTLRGTTLLLGIIALSGIA